jgi:enoyl-CoA hydratase/carnithine racemase
MKPEQLVNDSVLFRLPSGVSLYESRAREFVSELTAFAEDLHRQSGKKIKGVLLLQENPADDRTDTWLAELENETLFRELASRIDAYRWLLSLIRNSPVPWVYASASDCVGSFWELALSCQRRYWYASGGTLGFPEIAVGAFPPGGVLESLSRRTGRTRERWAAKPTFSASDALLDGLIHFCLPASNWEEDALAMFQEMLRVNPKTGVRESRRRRNKEVIDVAKDNQSRRAAYEELETVWKQERLKTHKTPSAWDYCWQLVKGRGRLKDSRQLGSLIGHIAARHFLSQSYISWLSTHLVERAVLDVPDKTAACMPPVVIDLNALAPPTEVLLQLLSHNLRLVFVASESKALAAAINLLFNRLERATNSQTALSLWEPSVTWYQGQADETRSLVLRWSVDDRFLVAYEGETVTFVRLEGNGSSAKPGLMEWEIAELSSSPLSPQVLTIVGITSGGMIHTRPGRTLPLPLSVHVRSLFFEEMLRVARSVDGDLGLVAEGLKANGWSFAGDEEAWDRFLKARHDAYPYDAELSRFGVRQIERSHWEIGSWKHARAMVKKSGAEGVRRRNPTWLSQHLAMFAGLLARSIGTTDRVTSPEHADYLCAVALGFPEAYGTPLAYLRQRGITRVEHYAASHWPLLPAATLSKSPGSPQHA